MGKKRGFALGLVLVTFVAAGTALARHSSTTTRRPGFTARVTNPWYPLKPGSRYVYRGVEGGESSREVMTVTHRTRMIDGAPCAVIDDRVYVRGRLEERTTDWYSQDASGIVWYFGERTAELDRNGKITSTEGSWIAGVHGAKPGIFMFAHPRAGQQARQEYYKGHAEDHFRVVRMRTSITVPFISSTRAMLTREWTPLEPGVIDHKYYVRGIGTVLEQTVKGPVERNELVSFRRGP